MPGCIYKLEELSSPSVAALDRQATIFFIPISPIEGHGPHLPLGVDLYDAQYFAGKLAELLHSTRPDFDIVLVPAIPLGAQVYRQPGSIRTDARALYRVACGLGESLASWGFRYIFLLSGHGSPRHIVTLESACVKVSKKYKIQMHNLSGALAIRFLRGEFVERISTRLPKPLTPEEKELLANDIHGGWWETSMMLYLHPELVGEYKNLETIKRTEKDPARKLGYNGSPHLASREFAVASLDVMTEEAVGIIERILTGNHVKSDTVSFLYRMPLLRPYSIMRLTVILMGIAILVLLAIIVFR
jgi:creatinine amidohydrolase